MNLTMIKNILQKLEQQRFSLVSLKNLIIISYDSNLLDIHKIEAKMLQIDNISIFAALLLREGLLYCQVQAVDKTEIGLNILWRLYFLIKLILSQSASPLTENIIDVFNQLLLILDLLEAQNSQHFLHLSLYALGNLATLKMLNLSPLYRMSGAMLCYIILYVEKVRANAGLVDNKLYLSYQYACLLLLPPLLTELLNDISELGGSMLWLSLIMIMGITECLFRKPCPQSFTHTPSLSGINLI